MIELTGDYDFAAPKDLVWEMSLDPEVLARVMPGCKELKLVGENEYQGQMSIKIGPVHGVFQGRVILTELQAPSGYHVAVNGRGPAGVVQGEGDVALAERDAGTRLSYDGTAQVSGRIATVGQRLMDSSAKAITSQSLQNLDKQIQARLVPETQVVPDQGAPAEIAPAAPDQAEFMLGVAKEVVNDLVSDPQQRRLLVGALAAVGLIALANWFANLVARRVIAKLEHGEHRASDK